MKKPQEEQPADVEFQMVSWTPPLPGGQRDPVRLDHRLGLAKWRSLGILPGGVVVGMPSTPF